MEVRFWGTRGSIPASLTAQCVRQKVLRVLKAAVAEGIGPGSDLERFVDQGLPFSAKATYGTNTPCVEIRDGQAFVLCDAGTGLRDYDARLKEQPDQNIPNDFHILLSHLHWDHIQGFPFFSPLYSHGNRITVYGCHETTQAHFSMQHSQPFFPVCFNDIHADLRFITLQPDHTHEIAGFRVTPKEQSHPGRSYGYRVKRDGKTVVYSTDSEHVCEGKWDATDPFVTFLKDSDLVIFDAQYFHRDACTIKQNWGHSSSEIGVALAEEAGVKHLCLYHLDSALTDGDLDGLLDETNRFASQRPGAGALKISMAWDGMVLEI
jgi:phosphoribosyl 1,2-cyclic phosphodiesterase